MTAPVETSLVELADDTLEKLSRVSTNTITGVLMKIAGMRTRAVHGVRPVNPALCRFVGPAYTVRYVPIREDLTADASLASPTSHLAGTLDAVPAGSVLMIDMMRDDTSGALGDVLVARLIALEVAGVVADGGMRDTSVISGMSLPVFCAATAAPPSSRSLMAAGVGEIIGCGGVMVAPGDIVVGDADGVAVIPRHLADEVATKGEEQEHVEVWVKNKIEAGEKLAGLYPPGEATLAAYRAWRETGAHWSGFS
jgi:regulator of RNase E activity RraA